MADLSEYKELYIKTASDLLQQLKQDFAVFQEIPSDELIVKLHRNAHSLKGQSLVMGYESVGLLSKELEFIFRAVKDKQLVLTAQLNQALADAVQNLYDSIESIKSSDKELDLSGMSQNLETLSGIQS
jgi:two-component system, chemotaxis family, sensor kinase CheA